ncbi:hypothetical protein ABT369_49260 [Dactylosporangium sp. NPDC000244]|uniref:hypothetical protein n=1 Tax=Dactylosporangium sp. NPDC000244 TaxID=3154365 RepID=UPI0033236D44
MTGRRRRGNPPENPPPARRDRRPALDIERIAEPARQAAERPSPDAPKPPPGRRPAPVPAPRRSEIFARFGTASAALGCAGRLVGAHRDGDVRAYTRADEWWLHASVELDLARSVVHATGGTLFVLVEGRFVRDRGFGQHPSAGPADAVEPSTLLECPLLDLVRAAGLHPVRSHPAQSSTLILPGAVTADAVRRALDAGLNVRHQPVRLRPLWGEATAASPANVRLDLTAAQGAIAPTLLQAFARLPVTLVARACGREGNLLLQHSRATPMPDQHLAALVGEDRLWVLADAAFGCWWLEPLAPAEDATGLVMTAPGFHLRDQTAPPARLDETSTSPTVRVIADPAANRRCDALLLDDAELGELRLLLEGHPLAELALIVPGADAHLMLAPGGLLETFAVGRPLTCIGPGLLYIGRGRRLDPDLPPTARRRLFAPDPGHAVVLLGDRGLRFRLDEQRPVWTLWASAGPPIVEQLPNATVAALRDLDPQPQAPRPQTPFRRLLDRMATPIPVEELLQQALAAEAAGDLPTAAELHRRRGDAYRAGELYERAAERER